jgi:hypothetical protein
LLLQSCSESKSNSQVSAASGSLPTDKYIQSMNEVWDTTYTVILYSFNWNNNDHRITTAVHGKRTTYVPDEKDPSRNVKKTIDVYRIPFWQDSIDANKKPIVDSAGNVIKKKHLVWVELNPPGLLLSDFKKEYK